jgi:DHA3 family tetracycline resistance protein-like MFS transporter
VDGPRPYPVYLFINVAFGLSFMLYATISSVYRIQTVGLNPLQLVLVGTALELAVLICEVPTGVLADTYGRRRSVILGFLLIGAGFSFEGALPTFAAVLAAQLIWGAGYTFVSGALQAWIADELGGEDLGRVYLRGEQADYLGSFLGVFASALLATVALNLPLLIGGAFAVALGATLVFLMRERSFRPAPREGLSEWAQASATARGGVRLVRGHPALLILLAVAVFFGMSGEGFDRLWEAHLLKDIGLPAFAGLEPVLWFGLINAGTLVLSYLAAEVLGRALDVGNVAVAARLLFVLNALTIVGVLAFALAGSFAFALGAFWFASLTRKLFYPLYLTWVNRGLDPNVRATVISISNQANSLGELAGGPVVGAVGTLASIRAALATAALVLSPALFLYGRAIRHDGVEPGLEAPNDTEKSN